MEYSTNEFIKLLSSGGKKAQLLNRLRELTNDTKALALNCIPLIDSSFINRDDVFDEIFWNKVCRDHEIIRHITNKRLPLTQNQKRIISETKHIQHDYRLRKEFEEKYDFKVVDKRYSIQRLNRLTRDRNIAISSHHVNRTMKVGINMETVAPDTKKFLDMYLEEWESIRNKILADIYRIFLDDESKILLRACDRSYSEEHKRDKVGFKKEYIGKKFPIGGSGSPRYRIFRLSYKGKGGTNKERVEYVAENGANCLKLSEKDGELKISKFSSQSLYNNLISPKYFSVNPIKKAYQSPLYQGLKVNDIAKVINASGIRETLGASIAETVCSFLDKYYASLSEIDVRYDQNKKTFDKNNEYIKKGLFVYPEKPEQRNNEVTDYNAFITTYNQHLNEYVWQKSEEKDIRKKAPKLSIIKGIPSFPVLGKAETRDYEKIMKEMISTYRDVKQEVLRVQSPSINARNLAEWLGKKSARSGRKIRSFFDSVEKKECLNRNKYGWLEIASKDAYQIWSDLVHYLDEDIKHSKIDISTPQKARETADSYAQYVSIASELVFDKSSKAYTDFRLKFNKLTALLKASPFEDLQEERREIAFAGFSCDENSLKKKFAFCFKETGGKLQFYVLFNLKQDIKLKFSKTGEYHALGYIGTGDRQRAIIKPISFEHAEGTCLLPLAFGKRIGRKYLYNNHVKSNPNSLKFLESLFVKFSNARIIRETKVTQMGKQERYYCAISLEQRFPKSKEVKDTLQQNIQSVLGIDMGEKIPAVVALVDRNSNLIRSVWYLRPEMNDRLRRIQDRKDKEQRENGIVPSRLNKKIRNVTQKLLEDIAIQTLELSIRNNAMLVTESLPRGFGRGRTKGTYVWMRQYTKLNDILASKARELGITDLRNDKDYSQKTAVYKPRGYLVKVPAGYTSKTSIQTGFILRNWTYFDFDEKDIRNTSTLTLKDEPLGVTMIVDLDTRAIRVDWNGRSQRVQFGGKAKELGLYYDEVLSKEKFEYYMDTVFNKRGSNSLERRLSIKRFASNLLNPRKEQAIYTDIFTGKHVNADAQGAVNVARSYLFSLSDVYDETVKGVDRLKCWQDWYIQTLTNIPSFLYTCEDKQA